MTALSYSWTTLKQTQREKGRVTTTMEKEMAVRSQPQRLVPRSSSLQGKSALSWRSRWWPVEVCV